MAVRFDNFGKPKTVIVSKISYKNKKDGDPIGARGNALWVTMMEKAYAAVLAGYVKDCDGNQKIKQLDDIDRNGPDETARKLRRNGFSLIRHGNPYDALDVGGKMEDFISMFVGTKQGKTVDMVQFHKKAASVSTLSKDMRKDMTKEARDNGRQIGPGETARYNYYDRKIYARINAEFTRTKVKTYSEYMEALDSVKEAIEDDPQFLADHPATTMSLEEQKEAFFSYIKLLGKHAKTNKKLLHVDHTLVGEGGYTAEETAVFNELEEADRQKKLVSLTTRHSHKFLRWQRDHRHTEDGSGGFYAQHEYAFMGTVRIREKGVDRLFVRLRNPWGHTVRMYDTDARAKELDDTTEEQEEYREKVRKGTKIQLKYEHQRTNGVFLMELRDFLNMGEKYQIER